MTRMARHSKTRINAIYILVIANIYLIRITAHPVEAIDDRHRKFNQLPVAGEAMEARTEPITISSLNCYSF